VHKKLPTAIQQKGENNTNLMSVAIDNNRQEIAEWLVSKDQALFTEAVKQDFSEVLQQESYKEMRIWINKTTKSLSELETQRKEAESRKIADFFSTIENYKSERDANTIHKSWANNPTFFDFTNEAGENALHIAARKGHTKLIVWMRIVGLFTKLNVATKTGWKPLHLAVKNGHLNFVEELTQNDLTVLEEDLPNIGTVKSIAFEEGQIGIVIWLEEKKHLLQKDQTYDQLFDQVLNLKIKNPFAIDWLHKEKLKDDQQNQALENALLISVEKGTLAIAEWVLEKDPEIIQKIQQKKKNLMSIAIGAGQLEITKWLDSKDGNLFGALKGQGLSGIIDRQKYPQMADWVSQRALQ
jgi:ankyrin repeat protein